MQTKRHCAVAIQARSAAESKHSYSSRGCGVAESCYSSEESVAASNRLAVAGTAPEKAIANTPVIASKLAVGAGVAGIASSSSTPVAAVHSPDNPDGSGPGPGSASARAPCSLRLGRRRDWDQ